MQLAEWSGCTPGRYDPFIAPVARRLPGVAMTDTSSATPEPRVRHARAWFIDTARSGHQQLDALDGLRGLAVLVVVASHLSNSEMHVLPALSLSGIGKSGVYRLN